jgi:hypothetical protein
MCLQALLIQIATWHVEVKWRFKGGLGLMRHINPAIPTRAPEGTRGVRQVIEYKRDRRVGGIFQRDLIHLVGCRIVLHILTTDSSSQTIDIFQIGFYICSPLAFRKTDSSTVLLNASCCIHHECGSTLVKGLAELIPQSITCNAHIINLMEIIKLQPRHGLLFRSCVEIGHLLTEKTEVFYKN